MFKVIFTGAGASRPFGYPTTREFFEDGWLRGLQPVTDVFNQAKDFLRTQIVDVEDILGLLEPTEDLLKSSSGQFLSRKITENWIAAIPDLAGRIRDRCFDLYSRRESLARVPEVYEPLLELCEWRQWKVSLFTTNYDPVPDRLMELAEEKNLPAHDGFKRLGYWDPPDYDNSGSGLAIYRLHGSISWVREADRVVNTRAYSRMRNRDHLVLYPGFKGNAEEANSLEVFKLPHKALRDALRNAHILIVIGFSFRDPCLNRIFRETLAENQILRVGVVNPEWPEGPGVGLKDLTEVAQGRIQHLKVSFGTSEAIEEITHFIQE